VDSKGLDPRKGAAVGRVGAVLALAMAVRLLACFGLPEVRFPDSVTYEDLAGSIRERMSLEDRFGSRAAVAPGYPLFIAGCRTLLGGSKFAYRLPQLVLGLGTVLGLYLLGGQLWGHRAGLLAAALGALDPFSVYFESLQLTEGPALCLLVWTGLCAWLARRKTWAAPLCGALAGVTALVRPGWVHICGPLLFTALVLAAKSKVAEKTLWLRGALAAAALLAVLSPWWIRNYVVLGAFVPFSTGGGQALYEGNSENATGGPAIPQTVGARMRGIDGLSELERDALLGGEARMWIRDNPGEFARLAAIKFARTWSPLPNEVAHRRWYHLLASIVDWAAVMLLAVAGAWLLRRERGKVLWCLVPAIVVIVAHVFIIGSVRYRMPAWPFLGLLAGGAAAALSSRLFSGSQAGAEVDAPAPD